MLNWEHVIFRSFYYIGLLSPLVFISCAVIICISQYLKQKSKKDQTLKKLKKKSKYATFTDVTSDDSTQLLCMKEGSPNQHLYRLDEVYLEEDSPMKNSFINITNKTRLRHSDSASLCPEEDADENVSQNVLYLYEEPYHIQNEGNDFEELISPKLTKSMGNTQSKYRSSRQNILHSDNSKKNQCKCNHGYKKSNSVESNSITQDHFTGNRNSDDIILTIDPDEVVCKTNEQQVCDRQCRTSQMKNALSKNKMLENNKIRSTKKNEQNDSENDQEYINRSTGKSQLLKTHEECPICTAAKRKKTVPAIQKTKCVPCNKHNLQEICEHKDFSTSVFQNSNIPIAKRVLEEDQFYDLRQKFYNAENMFLNASKPLKDEPSYNARYNCNKQMYQPDESEYVLKSQKYFEEGNTKDFGMQYSPQISNATVETGDENHIENVSSTCNSTGKEELVCKYWKSLKTEIVSQKKNKAVQTGISPIRQRCNESLLQKYEETIPYIQTKQNFATQTQDITAKGDTLKNVENQNTQTDIHLKPFTPNKLQQIGTMEYHPFPREVPLDMKHITNRTCKNCQIFQPPADYSKEKIRTDTTKPVTMHTSLRSNQTEVQYLVLPCHNHPQSDHTELTENFQYCDNCYFRPKFTAKCGNMNNRCFSDDALEDKYNYVCHPVVPMSQYENNEYLDSYNDTRKRQLQSMCLEQENMHSDNHFAQVRNHEKYKHRTSSMEKEIYQQNEHMQKQMKNRQWMNFRESPNKIPITDVSQNNNSTNGFNCQINSWNDRNRISRDNVFHDKNKDIKNEDNITQPLLLNTRNNSFKKHDVTETDDKAVQNSEKASLSPNHTKDYNKRTLKEVGKKQTETDAGQFSEKKDAEQIHAKQNVLKQIKRMYSHIDQNVHETNKNVITQVKKVLKTKGMWQSEK